MIFYEGENTKLSNIMAKIGILIVVILSIIISLNLWGVI